MSSRKKTGAPFVIVELAGIAGFLVLGVVAFGLVFFLSRPVLDSTAVAAGVDTVLQDSYHIDGVDSVTCPADQKVVAYHRFRCQALRQGMTLQIPVRIVDEAGTYEVGIPE